MGPRCAAAARPRILLRRVRVEPEHRFFCARCLQCWRRSSVVHRWAHGKRQAEDDANDAADLSSAIAGAGHCDVAREPDAQVRNVSHVRVQYYGSRILFF